MAEPNITEAAPINYLKGLSGNAVGKKHFVILGGGIIGACSAYYLTRHPKFDPKKHHVTILEATEVAGGASGKAGGLLASWAFPDEIVPLSFQLHQELSDEYGGEELWGYRRLNTFSLEADAKNASTPVELIKKIYHLKVPAPKKRPVDNGDKPDELNDDDRQSSCDDMGLELNVKSGELPKDIKWIKKEMITSWSSLGGKDTTAQIHPFKFTRYIISKAAETGAVDVVLGSATKINLNDDGAVNGVTFTPTSNNFNDYSEIDIDNVANVIVAMGPWTSKILLDCPVSGLRAHSIVLQPKSSDCLAKMKDLLTPHALFTELQLPNNQLISPEIYSRTDELYICGDGDTLLELPDRLDQVSITEEKCEELLTQTSKLLSAAVLENTEVVKKQACYLPVLNVPSNSGPIIGETNVRDLFVASGHSCWGINNAPATGKIISELLLDGKSISADITKLDPTLYFDASILD